MTLVELDVLVRICGLSVLMLLAWLLFRSRRSIGAPALLFPPLALCLSGFVIGNTPLQAPHASLIWTIAHGASGFTVVFLWWFCLSCFEKGFRPAGWVLAVGLAWSVLAAADRGLLGPMFADKGLSRLLVALGYAIVGHMVWRLAAGRSGDLVQARHDARIVTAVLLGGMLLVDLTADTLFGFSWRPLAFALSQNLAILVTGLWLAGQLLTARPDVLTFGVAAPPHAARPAPVDPPWTGLRARLNDLMEKQQLFLDPNLTFAEFVSRMGAPERTVRQLVNRELGFDHFRTFLNQYRMAEACRRLSDPAHDEDKLIAVALDSGFASLASFNRVFLSVEGCSPGQYRARARAGRARVSGPGDLDAAAGF